MASGSTVHEGNLDQTAQNGRIRMGIALLFVSLAGAVILTAGGFPTWTRGILFFPLLMVAFGALQGLHQICPGHAAKGTREVDGCARKVSDPEEAERIRSDARKLMIEAVAGASLATGLLFLLP